MRYLSVCSGIEAASVAWHPLGWQPVLFSEIEKFPRAVLRHRQRARDARHGVRPSRVPLWGDLTTIRPRLLRRLGIESVIDLLVGGTPCQSFSVAGLRRGLADPRGNLALAFLLLARRFRPRWVVWENVPGVLSSNGGRDFGAFLGGLEELGYGWSYRVLDAQFFGVPQRRRRVFVVGYLGDWRRAAAVLFERHSLSGNPAPRRKAGEGSAGGAAPCLDGSFGRLQGCSGQDANHGHGHLVAHMLGADGYNGLLTGEVSAPPSTQSSHNRNLVFGASLAPVAFQDSQSDTRTGDTFATLDAHYGPRRRIGVMQPVAFDGMNQAASEVHPSLRVGRDSGDCVAMSFDWQKGNDKSNPRPSTMNIAEDQSQTLGSTRVPAVAFQPKASVTQSMNPGPVCPTLGTTKEPAVVIGDPRRHDENHRGWANPQEVHPTLPQESPQTITFQGMAVRRITPREAERLQGFPDDYTKIPAKRTKRPPSPQKLAKYPDCFELGEDGVWTQFAPDGPRYKALGNSMAVPVMAWIGQRIQMVEELEQGHGRIPQP